MCSRSLSSAALASKGEPCVRWTGWGARVYLEIVRLGASFHGRQRVYGRLGHFDLHHLPRAQGGGIRTDMGSCKRRRAPNLKTGESAAGKRHRDRTYDGKGLLMSPAEREKGSLVEESARSAMRLKSSVRDGSVTAGANVEVRTKCASVPGVSVSEKVDLRTNKSSWI